MSLGTSSSKTQQQVHPYFTNTGRSSITGSTFSLDPTIERLRQQAAQGITGAGAELGGQLSAIQGAAFGNLPDYVKAQLAPLQQEQATQRGQLEQTLGQRRLLGSSFANQARTGQGIDFANALANARANAIAGGAGQLAGLAQQQFGGQQAVNQALSNMAQQRLAQELGIFGLGTRGTSGQTSQSLSLNPFNLLFGG